MNIENYKNFMVAVENTTPSNFPLKNLSVKQTFMKNEYGKGREVTSIKVFFEEKKKTFDILILVDGKNNVFLTNNTKNPKKVQCNLRLK